MDTLTKKRKQHDKRDAKAHSRARYGLKWLINSRKGDKGSHYRVNAASLRGSRLWHDPEHPKLDMFEDPDAEGVDRALIGRYGHKPKGARAFPLILLRAAFQVANGLYHKPLEYTLTRRWNEKTGAYHQRYSQAREALSKLTETMVMNYQGLA